MKRIITVALLLAASSSQAQTITKVECGAEFTIARKSDSTLWGFGMNYNRQLGTTDFVSIDTATPVMTTKKWIDVASGAFHTLAIDADGKLWGWGYNGMGNLGVGTYDTPGLAPTLLDPTSTWLVVSGGFAHSMAIKTDGTLWAAGWNMYGQLGSGDTANAVTWRQVGTDNNWVKVSTGSAYTMAIKSDGSLWAWGLNLNGELGLNYTSNSVLVPTRVGTDNNWKDVSCGFEFAVGIKSDGTIWSTGFNGNGNLGRTITGTYDSVFAQIGTATDWARVAAGSSFAMAIKTNGTLWGWGYNQYGELGMGTTLATQPVAQSGTETTWQYIVCADGASSGATVFGLHTAGIKGDAKSLCTAGANYVGQLGNGTTLSFSVGQPDFGCDVAIPASIEDINSWASNVEVYPNPATSMIFIKGLTLKTQYQIVDVAGKVITVGEADGNNPVDISSLTTGQYLLKITANNTVKTVLFTKD